MSTPLVLIERTGAGLKEWLYSRVLGRRVTHAVKTDAPLEPSDIEALRMEPDKMLGPVAA